MEVDTGSFRALTRQVAALGAEVRELARAQLAGQLERAALLEEGERRAMARMPGRRPEGRHARPRGDRHGLRLVGGGEVTR
jgi:hypothetical protein